MTKSAGLSVRLRRFSQQRVAESFHTAVRLAQQGYSSAFEYLYKAHRGSVYRLCLHLTNDPLQSAKLTRETFLTIFRDIGKCGEKLNYNTWFNQLIAEAVRQFRARQSMEISLDDPTECSQEQPEPFEQSLAIKPGLHGTLNTATVRAAVALLGPRYREVFVLHSIEGYEHTEIAEILEISIEDSHSQFLKACIRLRSLLSARSEHAKKEPPSRSVPSESVRTLADKN